MPPHIPPVSGNQEAIVSVKPDADHTSAEVTLTSGATYLFTVYKGSDKAKVMSEVDWRDIAEKTIKVLRDNHLPISTITKGTLHLTKDKEAIQTENNAPQALTQKGTELRQLQEKINSFATSHIAQNPPPFTSSGQPAHPPKIPTADHQPVQAAPKNISITRNAAASQPPIEMFRPRGQAVTAKPHIIEPQKLEDKPFALPRDFLYDLSVIPFQYNGKWYNSIGEAFRWTRDKIPQDQRTDDRMFREMLSIIEVVTSTKGNSFVRNKILKLAEINILPKDYLAMAVIYYRDREIYLQKLGQLQSDGTIVKELSPEEGTKYVNGELLKLPVAKDNQYEITIDGEKMLPPEIFGKDFPRGTNNVTVSGRSFEFSNEGRNVVAQAVHDALGKDKAVTFNALKFINQDVFGYIIVNEAFKFALNLTNTDGFNVQVDTPTQLHAVEVERDRVKFKSKMLMKLHSPGVNLSKYRWVVQEVNISKEELRTGVAKSPIVTRSYTPFFDTREEANKFAFDQQLLTPQDNFPGKEELVAGVRFAVQGDVGVGHPKNIQLEGLIDIDFDRNLKPKRVRDEKIHIEDIDEESINEKENIKSLLDYIKKDKEFLEICNKEQNKKIEELNGEIWVYQRRQFIKIEENRIKLESFENELDELIEKDVERIVAKLTERYVKDSQFIELLKKTEDNFINGSLKNLGNVNIANIMGKALMQIRDNFNIDHG